MGTTDSKKRPPIRAVPWRTPTAEKVRGALGELPAYVRRARRTEDAVADLFREAATNRDEMLSFVCLRLRRYLDSLPDPGAAHPAVREVHRLVKERPPFRELRPRSFGRPAPKAALDLLAGSVERFNRRWKGWIDEEGRLDRANREIDGYNRYYALERQVAVRYVPVDQLRFERKTPLEREDLLREFPLLPRIR